MQGMKTKQQELLRKARQSLNARSHQRSDSVLALPQVESDKADLPDADGGVAPSWMQGFSAIVAGWVLVFHCDRLQWNFSPRTSPY